MEVKEIFELRRQGRTEEAYDAIRKRYAEHKGHYTTLAMFWVAVDVMHLRFKQRRLSEAYKIFLGLLRIYPQLADEERSGQRVLLRAALVVADYQPGFSMLSFITDWGIDKLTADDWKMSRLNDHLVPALAMRILSRVFREVEAEPTVDMALKAAPILAEALKNAPLNMNYQRYKAIIYRIMGKRNKAINIYKHLLQKYKRAYLYQELADLIDDEKLKIAFLVCALVAQKDDKFRQKLRFRVAEKLFRYDKSRSKYELERCIATRKRLGYAITYEMQNLQCTLADVESATDISQKSFYQRVENFVRRWVQTPLAEPNAS